MAEPLPVLWLCGPPGVGKTVVGWELYSQLVAAGVAAAYVDIDQLGMCYPEPVADAPRHRMKTRNLAAVVAGVRRAGVRCLVVSGVVDAAGGVDADLLPEVALTLCRLRSGHAELRERFLGRGAPAELLPDVLREADALDASGIAAVDTSGRPVGEVVRLVRDRTGGGPGPAGLLGAVAGARNGSAEDGGEPPGGDVLWVCGPTGVGKSTIGFAVYRRLLQGGTPAAFVDLRQLGFVHPAPPGHRVPAGSVAGLWRNFRREGARSLVMVGPAEDAAAVAEYAGALPAATLTVCRLHAGRAELAERILGRRGGGSWPEPGDPLAGRPVPHLLRVADQAAADAERLERAALGDVRVDTTGLTVERAADLVLAGWRPAAAVVRPG